MRTKKCSGNGSRSLARFRPPSLSGKAVDPNRETNDRAAASAPNELLQDPRIQRFIETHQGCEARVRRAAELLHNEPDGLTALKKILPALSQGTINIFFSYKQKDEPTAERIVDVLRTHSDRLHITYQADFTMKIAGKEYRKWILDSVRNANWFILLLPDPSEDYDWCLFETGEFEAVKTSADRMICLHHKDYAIPGAIEGYHAVAATTGEVGKFLKMVYLEPDPIPGLEALHPRVADKIPQIAETIVNAMSPPKPQPCPQMLVPWVKLQIDNARELKNVSELDPARVLSVSNTAMQLFEFIDRPKTFGDLRSGLAEEDGDDRWRQELMHVVRKIANGRLFHPIQAVVRVGASRQKGKIYRPVLCNIDRLGEGGPIHAFNLAFVEEVSTIDHTGIPQDIVIIASVSRFAFRFRWEVIEAYGRRLLNEEEIIRLSNCLERISRDWQSRGIGGQEEILTVFTDAQRDRVKLMFAQWVILRNPGGTGELDVALKAKDAPRIRDLLQSVIPLNEEFMELATERFSELATRK